jgi:hypothetical protein
LRQIGETRVWKILKPAAGREAKLCWGKQHGTMRKTKHRGVARVAGGFFLNLIAYNLIRIAKLVAT